MIELINTDLHQHYLAGHDEYKFMYEVSGQAPEISRIKELRDAAATTVGARPWDKIEVTVWGDWYGDINKIEFPDYSLHYQSYNPARATNLDTARKWLKIEFDKQDGIQSDLVTTEGIKGFQITIRRQ